MIKDALVFLRDYLNREIRLTYGIDEDKVVVGSLIDPDGSLAAEMTNRMVLSLVCLEQEAASGDSGKYISSSAGGFERKSPPIHLNLFVLMSANYHSSNYLEALKMLSSSIAIFQGSSVFDRSSHPEMEKSLNRLALEIVNMPLKDYSNIWNGIGAKYVPSIMYKIRLVTIEKDKIVGIIPEITGLDTKTKND
ncbi:MAG: hypothetical protein ACI837_003015 [Crocinitomicaceae bacterium]|jgi:hypothetical protein